MLGQRLEVEPRLDLQARDRNEIGRRTKQVAMIRVQRDVGESHEARLDATPGVDRLEVSGLAAPVEIIGTQLVSAP